MKKILELNFFILLLFLSVCNAHADNRPKIYSLQDKEIIANTNWTGQTFTLVKENNEYFIVRKFLGSGVLVVNETKYRVYFSSDYQLRFADKEKNEKFILTITEKNKIALFVNGFEVVIKYDL